MRNLVLILHKYGPFLLFLILQLFCFSLIVNNNRFQHASFVNSSNRVIGSMYSMISGIREYFHLKDVNQQLNEENTRLKQLIKGYTIKSSHNGFVKINDTVFHQQYEIQTAKVINITSKGRRNYLTLNAGSSNGVHKHMGIIGPKGVVGFVNQVGQNYATAVSILHEDFKLGVSHKKSNALGFLQWTKRDDKLHATIFDIPDFVPIKVGDSIVTNTTGQGMFPTGELIGTVASSEVFQGYHRIQILLATEYSKLFNVQLVRNVKIADQKSLENALE